MRIAMTWLLFCALGSVQLGCTSASDFATPRIAVQNVVALSAGAGQPRFRVTLTIDNPNPEPLPVYSFEFKLRLADQGILDGELPASVTIPALDQITATLDLSSDIISSLSRLLSFAEGPENTLSYEIYGLLRLDRTLRDPIPFSVRGRVPIAVSSEP